MSPRRPHKGFLHIKRGTAGTSNELSMSVLDAKKDAADAARAAEASPELNFSVLDAKKGAAEGQQATSQPMASGKRINVAVLRFGIHAHGGRSASSGASGGPVPADPTAEVARRKRRRRVLHAARAVVVVGVVAAVAVCGGGWLMRTFDQEAQYHAMLSESLSLLEKSDEQIVAMDQALAADLTENTLTQMVQIQSDLSVAEAYLNRSQNLAQAVAQGVQSTQDKEAAETALADISARRSLISCGKELMDEDVAAKRAANLVEDAWEYVLAGDSLARTAAADASTSTDESVQRSIEESEQAIELFEQAASWVGQAQENYPSADLSALSAYIAKRIEAQNAAIESDGHMLLRDRASAEAANDVANAAEEEAATMAQSLPDDPVAPIKEAYAANAETPLSEYRQAREKVAETDGYLREYLGA